LEKQFFLPLPIKMTTLIFATNNQHKLQEIRQILKQQIQIKSLKDIGFHEEIPETNPTLEGNALQKARYIYERYHTNCMADDTGLEIEALNGKPGVYSARYAGESCSYEDNMQKVLLEMNGKTNRKAKFRTVIALILDNKEYLFDGEVNGIITTEKHGTKGFGYDPIFLPDGETLTFAELQPEQKNKISHRGLATAKLVNFLNTILKLK